MKRLYGVGVAIVILSSLAFVPSKEIAIAAPQPTIHTAAPMPPILLKIAQCESNDRQFRPDGSLVRGDQNKHDIGRFQINETFWRSKSIQLGYDIYTFAGNTAFALWLYASKGPQPWNWSRDCWGSMLN